MKLLRRIFAVLVWVVATVVVLLAAILCVTIILLPLGIPLMGVGMRMFGYGTMLMLPRVELPTMPAAGDVADAARKRWRRGKKQTAKSTKRMRKRLAV